VAAARDEQCRVVVIQRPPETTQHAYQDVQALLAALAAGRILTQGRLLQNSSWHGRPAHESRARCPCHFDCQVVLQEPQGV
jgi:hypothetical protein